MFVRLRREPCERDKALVVAMNQALDRLEQGFVVSASSRQMPLTSCARHSPYHCALESINGKEELTNSRAMWRA